MSLRKNLYVFISDEFGNFYRANQQPDGTYAISGNVQPYPIVHEPKNIGKGSFEFGTNEKYFSCVRTVTDRLEFIKDGAAILRYFNYTGTGVEAKVYITIVEFNSSLGYYELSYKGKVIFKEKEDDPKSGTFIVPLADDSVWGALSKKDNVKYSFDCSPFNPKAIKVLIDSITLLNKFTFQPVNAAIEEHATNWDLGFIIFPFVFVTQDGDSTGVIVKSQVLEYTEFLPQLQSSLNWFFKTSYILNNVNVSGTFSWIATFGSGSAQEIYMFFTTSSGQYFEIYRERLSSMPLNVLLSVNFNFNVNLAQDERIFFGGNFGVILTDGKTVITPIVTNIFVKTQTKALPQVVYGIRAVDLAHDIVLKATNGRFSLKSNFFTANNKDVCLSGDSIRQVANAKLYTSFEDFFKSFDAIYFMALRIYQGELYMEKATEVYRTDTQIIDLGDAIDLKLTTAKQYMYNQITVGSPKQDYRHPSGRLEFNSPNSFSFPVLEADDQLTCISVYRLGCYDIMFLVIDYQNENTTDNSGDKSVYVVDITDEIATAVSNIPTFIIVNINDAMLEPIIKSPGNTDTITNDKPTVRGIANPGSTINIYVDGALDGTTNADSEGFWSYNIVTSLSSFDPLGSATGAHLIQATFTDLLGPTADLNIIVDTTYVTPIIITYPTSLDSLYNNRPLIKGTAQAGTNVPISINGVSYGTIPADGSGRWQLYPSSRLPNGNNTIQAGGYIVNFYVDAFTQFPLITYVNSELDGHIVINNLPLISGVGVPGTIVTLWFDYIPYAPLGTTVVNSDGAWTFQVVPVNYIDPVSGTPVVLAPLANGQHTISTSLINHTVGINVQGYRLNRPNFDSITGVPDNSVFNTKYSPKRMFRNQFPRVKPIGIQLGAEKASFETADKNGQLVTILGTDTVDESSDVPFADMGDALYLLEVVNIKVKAKSSFNKILENFSNGGLVRTVFKGYEVFMLPIGRMKLPNLMSSVQNWELMLSPRTSFNTLLNLYKNGTNIKVMKGSIFHSDYNSLHLTTYDFQPDTRINTKDIYDDWFENRNQFWSNNPTYIQRYMNNEVIRDQIICNGVTNAKLEVYDCLDGKKLSQIPYVPVAPAQMPGPEVLMELAIDFSNWQNKQIFFVLVAESGTAPSGTLIVTFTQVTGADIVSYAFSGTITAGEIVRMNWRVGPNIYVRDIVCQAGWVIADLLAAIQVVLSADPTVFIATNPFVDPDGNAGLSTFTGTGTNPSLGIAIVASIIPYNAAISERIQTADAWPRTILIRGKHSLNRPGIFFNTPFETYIRVEGLVKKMQPNIETIIADEEDGDTELLYSKINKKRTIRFGTAYGLPDYLYMKIALALGTDLLEIENVGYTLENNEEINPSDDVDGHPLYYYNVNLKLRDSILGATFAANSEGKYESVIMVLDSEAVGLPSGQLINIELYGTP